MTRAQQKVVVACAGLVFGALFFWRHTEDDAEVTAPAVQREQPPVRRSPLQPLQPAQTRPPEPLRAVLGAVDAGPAPSTSVASDRWSQVPIDPSGMRALGSKTATPFNHALARNSVDLVRNCFSTLPSATAREDYSVQLFIEATNAGYDVTANFASSDAGIDAYLRRCLELALTTQLEMDAGVAPGTRYRIVYPLVRMPVVEPPDGGEAPR